MKGLNLSKNWALLSFYFRTLIIANKEKDFHSRVYIQNNIENSHTNTNKEDNIISCVAQTFLMDERSKLFTQQMFSGHKTNKEKMI